MTAASPESTAGPIEHRAFLAGIGVWLILTILLAVGQHRVPGLLDGDSYFHVGYVEVWGQQGLSRSFPWTTVSTWSDAFADKDLLFHAFLWPFVALVGETGAKIATTLLGSAVLGLLATFAARHRLAGATVWSLLVLGVGWHVLHRLMPVRSHVMAMLLLVIWVECLISSRWRWLAVVSFLQAWNHQSAPIYPALAIAFALGAWGGRGRPDARPVLATAGGVVLGFLVNPYVPNDIRAWWLGAAELMRTVLGVGTAMPPGIFGPELGEVGSRMLLTNHVTPFAWIALVAVALGFRGVALSARGRAATLLGLSALVLGLVTSRFLHEIAIPIAFVWGAVVTDELLRARGGLGAIGRRASGAAVVVSWLVALPPAIAELRDLPDYRSQERYRSGVRALADALPDGAVVFHTDAGAFNPLFRFAPEQRYLFALDPIFFYGADRARFAQWLRFRAGQSPDPVRMIADTFGADGIFLRRSRPVDEQFIGYLERHPAVERVYDDSECAAFRVRR